MSSWLSHVWETMLSLPLLMSFTQFMQQGGLVLWGLFILVALFWLLVVEKLLFLLSVFPRKRLMWITQWQDREERNSWYALAIRDAWLDEANTALFKHLPIVKLLVSLCPMLGLLGTVTGMISVFDVIAIHGNSDPQLMASGIALATIPTMAGMVAALIGMVVYSRLVKVCQRQCYGLEQRLRSQE